MLFSASKCITFNMQSMEKHIAKHISFLKYFIDATRKQKKKLIQDCSKGQLVCLLEIIGNTLRANIPIKENEVKLLKKYKKVLHSLWKDKASLKLKKNLMLKFPTAVIKVLDFAKYIIDSL